MSGFLDSGTLYCAVGSDRKEPVAIQTCHVIWCLWWLALPPLWTESSPTAKSQRYVYCS